MDTWVDWDNTLLLSKSNCASVLRFVLTLFEVAVVAGSNAAALVLAPGFTAVFSFEYFERGVVALRERELQSAGAEIGPSATRHVTLIETGTSAWWRVATLGDVGTTNRADEGWTAKWGCGVKAPKTKADVSLAKVCFGFCDMKEAQGEEDRQVDVWELLTELATEFMSRSVRGQSRVRSCDLWKSSQGKCKGTARAAGSEWAKLIRGGSVPEPTKSLRLYTRRRQPLEGRKGTRATGALELNRRGGSDERAGKASTAEIGAARAWENKGWEALAVGGDKFGRIFICELADECASKRASVTWFCKITVASDGKACCGRKTIAWFDFSACGVHGLSGAADESEQELDRFGDSLGLFAAFAVGGGVADRISCPGVLSFLEGEGVPSVFMGVDRPGNDWKVRHLGVHAPKGTGEDERNCPKLRHEHVAAAAAAGKSAGLNWVAAASNTSN
jgi:hypothetical protein